MTMPLLQLKSITTVRPSFFEGGGGANTQIDSHWKLLVTKVDLGHLHWNRQLDKAHLNRILHNEDGFEGLDLVSHLLDVQAVGQLPKAKALLGAYADRMLTAEEVIFCFRVLTRCTALVSRYEPAFDLHLARGIVAKEYNQYKLTDVLAGAQAPLETHLGRYLAGLLREAAIPTQPGAVVINIRNDGELNQAFLLASILKSWYLGIVVVLDASGANEQYSFGEWVPLLTASSERVSRYFDYFLPRQDYQASLRAILESISAGVLPSSNGNNIVSFGDEKHLSRIRPQVAPVEESFVSYIESLPVFRTAGQRTIVARLSPAKCHWAACKFCTINSQHLMPRGLSVFDDSYQQHFERLVEKIRTEGVESLILMDEALHPKVLLAFAKRLLSVGVKVVYRARCRFTNDLLEEGSCKLLFQSGCRYLGLGLEAASSRVNEIVNKHSGPPIDYDGVLRDLEDAGIRMHIYAILGFPTETREEISETATFLIERIARFRYLTVSANLFHLMKGSGIARAPREFDINSTSEIGDISLVLQFDEEERSKNYSFAESCILRIFQAEFLPDAEDPVSAEALWHFIDQTGIFYVQKVVHSKNPFHELAERRNLALSADFADFHYEPSYVFWIDTKRGENIRLLCDWITMNYARLPSWLVDFIHLFDSSDTLRENIERLLPLSRHGEALLGFQALAKSGFFLPIVEGVCVTDGPPAQSIFKDDLARSAMLRRKPAENSVSILTSSTPSESVSSQRL